MSEAQELAEFAREVKAEKTTDEQKRVDAIGSKSNSTVIVLADHDAKEKNDDVHAPCADQSRPPLSQSCNEYDLRVKI